MKQTPKDASQRGDVAELCAYLIAERERAALTVAQISSTTRIPRASLELIEQGRFDELPADVFARGFLRSYARCIGLDPEDVVRRYVDCRAPLGRVRGDVRLNRQAELLAGTGVDGAVRSNGGAPKSTRSSDSASLQAAGDTADEAAGGVEALGGEAQKAEPGRTAGVARGARSRLHATGTFIRRHLLDQAETEAPRRGAVTLAVIILVIAATLTMWNLLKRPADSGQGLTSAEPQLVAPRRA